MAVELATGYVSIVPTTRGIGGKLAKELDGPSTTAGGNAGKKIGAALGEGAQKGVTGPLTKARKVVEGFGGSTGRLGTFADRAKTGLSALGASGDQAASGIQQAALAGAGLVAVGLVKFAADGIGKFTQLADGVRSFQRVSGASAEESSKLVYAFGKVGVDAATAGNSVFMMAKKIGDGTTKLATFGVEVARSSDGSVNLTETLLRVGDAYRGMKDPAEKAALLQAAFGKSGKTLIPILTKTREELTVLFDEAKRTHSILSDDDLAKAVAYKRSMTELKNTVTGLQREIGGEVIPVVTQFALAWSKLIQWADSLASKIGPLKSGLAALATAMPMGAAISSAVSFATALAGTGTEIDKEKVKTDFANKSIAEYAQLVREGKQNTDAGREAKKNAAAGSKYLAEQEDALSVAMGGVSQKTKDQITDLANLKSAFYGFGDAQRSAQSAVIAYGQAQDDFAAAQENLNKAKMEGRQSDESDAEYARRIAGLERDVQTALLGVASAHDNVASTASAASVAQNALNQNLGPIGSPARLKAIAELEAYRAKNGDVTGAIGDAITKLQTWNETAPADKSVHVDTGQAVNALDGVIRKLTDLSRLAASFVIHAFGNPDGRASGGPVTAGKPYIVGENGPEMFWPKTSGTIIPNTGQASMRNLNPAAAGSGIVINFSSLIPDAAGGRKVIELIEAHERVAGNGWRRG